MGGRGRGARALVMYAPVPRRPRNASCAWLRSRAARFGSPPLAFVPTRVFFTSGVGTHETQRVAMQRALRKAGVADCNLVEEEEAKGKSEQRGEKPDYAVAMTVAVFL